VTATAPPAPAAFTARGDAQAVVLELRGDWTAAAPLPSFDELRSACERYGGKRWRFSAAADFHWDSQFMSRLFLSARHCAEHGIELDIAALPEGARRLLAVATAVKPQAEMPAPAPDLWQQLRGALQTARTGIRDLLEFVGGITLALLNMLRGRADVRLRDIGYFIEQCGPQALGIVALISVLVGMILAYLGSVQLRQFGAEVYVANLVTIGMVREMGALMTAVIMAGRTGAAYAAQLGAMQANEEVDAITTLGISPLEYLVLPRLLALVAVMPLLCIFSDALGLLGGGLVAMGMDVSAIQFIHQAREAVTFGDVGTGLIKSVVFGLLIATAGCQAGLQSGRSSAAVGQATTRAVVNAIVYLVVADAGLNILYDKLGI
jgi:phospholipid/cholesterol/gamma-HCH transport system permease protein